MRSKQFRRLIRFIAVGVLSSLAFIGAMALAVDAMHVPIVVATVAAFGVGTIVSYSGNTRWTFEALPTSRNLGRFLIVTLIGLGLSILIAWALDTIGVHYLLISLSILTLVPAWNFVAHGCWTYR